MSDTLRRALERRRDQAVRQAARRLLEDDAEGLEEPLRRLETCRRLLADWPRRRFTKAFAAAVVAVLSVGTVGLAWGLRQQPCKLVLDVRTGAFAVRLEEPWQWPPDGGAPPLALESARLDDWASLEIRSPPGMARELAGAPWAEIEGGRLFLRRLSLDRGGVLELEDVGRGDLEIRLREAASDGRLSFAGRPSVVAGERPGLETLNARPELSTPERIAFAAGGGAVPARLRLRPAGPWVVRDLRVADSLLFGSETAPVPGEPVFTSRITGGELRLVATSATFELEAGEPLVLTGVAGRVTKLSAEPGGGIHARFTGSAREVRLGPEGYDRDLRPTVLEALYHQNQMRFFGSAVVLVWGILWSIRELLFP